MGYGLLWVMGYGEAKISINAQRSNLLCLGFNATLSNHSLIWKISNSVWPQDLLALREDIRRKTPFSFGHCPKRGGFTHASIFWSFLAK